MEQMKGSTCQLCTHWLANDPAKRMGICFLLSGHAVAGYGSSKYVAVIPAPEDMIDLYTGATFGCIHWKEETRDQTRR